MEESTVIDLSVLKSLPQSIQSSNQNERRTLFEELDNVLIYSKLLNDKNEANILEGVFKVLLITLDRYEVKSARKLVNDLIIKLIKKYSKASQHLIKIVYNYLVELKPTGVFVSRKCVTLLRWLCLVNVDQLEQHDKQRLIQCHSIIISSISEIDRVQRFSTLECLALMKRLLNDFVDNKLPVELYINELVALNVESENSVFVYNLWEFLFEKLSTTDQRTLITTHQKRPVELLVKFIICSKTKIPKQKFYKYSHHIVKNIDQDQFKNEILPAIQKSVLRSAETALPVIDYLIENLAIDLSAFIEPISKLITSQLYGKEDSMRELSMNCFQNLATKSNRDSIEFMVNHLTSIYNGSEGKLTLPIQKSAVLQSIGSLSKSMNCDNKLIELTCLNLINFMKNEIHEPTLIEILIQVSHWSSKFDGKLSTILLEQLKSVFNLKSVTSLVKAINYLVLRKFLNKENVDQFKEFITLSNSSIAKGLSSNLSQLQLISEALFASNFILQLNLLSSNESIQPLMKIDKLPFLGDKFLAVCSKNECLFELIEFIRLLFKTNDLSKSVRDHEQIIFTTLIHLLNFRSNYEIRRKAEDLLKELLNDSTNSIKYVKTLVSCFIQLYSSMKSSDESTEDPLKPTANSIVQSIKAISSVRQPHKGDGTIDLSNYSYLLDLFIPCHIPLIYSSRNQQWLKLLNKYLNVSNVQSFIEANLQNLVNLSYTGNSNSKIQENCIKTLVNFYPEQFLPVFTKNIITCLRNPAFKSVSKSEYEIFKTPEGQLYDLSVIGTNAEQFNTKNLKKENKLYSYKEQLEEIKLREELSKKKNTELTKKQQEAKAIQLEKESEIRKRITTINEDFETSLLRLNTIIEGNALFTSFYLKDLIPSLIDLFKSHLCAEKATNAYLNLSRCVLDKRSEINYMVKAISYATLRQNEPNCEIDPEWTLFSLEEIESHLLDRLYNQVCSVGNESFNNGDDDEINDFTLDDQSKVLKPTTFAYIFPFISNLLVKGKRIDENFDKLLSIISQHLIKDFDEEIEDLEDLAKNPIYLPRKDLCKLLIVIMDQKSIVLAKKANKVFLQLSKSLANYSDDNEETSNEIYLLVIDNLNSENDLIRNACLDTLNDQLEQLSNIKQGTELYNKLFKSIWIAQFDSNKECELKSTEFWINYKFDITSELCGLVLDDILIYKYDLLESVSDSIAEILSEFNDQSRMVFDRLSAIYKEISPESMPTVDEFGRPLNRKLEDNYVPRLATAMILTKSAPYFSEEILMPVTNFLVYHALRDVNDEVRKQMLSCGIALINKTAKESLHQLLKILQKYLEEADNSQATDKVRASVVVLTGSLAARLDKNDPYIKPIIVKLIETLSTPSQMVQESVAYCLPGLVPAIKDDILPTLIDQLFKLLFDSDNYGEKKGSAYGIAGLVKGLGILSMNELEIINKCKKAINHKKPSRKLGALIAYEVFCNVLGKLFEPYVIKLIPNLFVCFGDTNENVRKATYETSKVIMNKLTIYGVKFILPALLEALNEENWRTKVGSVELLGAMAYLSPKALSSALPTVVPCLMKLVCDSHANVQKAANDSLKQIGYVVNNPEIKELVPILLSALDDPANKTQKCLDTMLTTKFVHFIDSPSLALIMPVIERAFQARSTKTRKSASQIIGNLYSLTDQNDLKPYLAAIIPGLKQSLLDPVPEVRGATARALGAMVRGVDDNMLEDILPWLMETLVSTNSSVDRSGAAQGLAEVIGGLGLDKLHKLMPEVITTTERQDISPVVKDGYLMLYIYLPLVFGQEFAPYIGKITHPILKALADENEFVRDTAFKAGQRIVNLYANTAIQLLLPELEQGLFNENWRIRYSSVQLLGDLLYKISGVSGKQSTETSHEDDNFGLNEKSFKQILITFGEERRNRVLSGLYMCRMDVSLQVRQASLHVWKIIVSNTPRTLKEIMPTLFTLLLSCLASKSYDQQQMAARTLGDLVKKMGQRILPQIIPILEKKLESDQEDQRQGVCIGLREIMASTSKEMVEAFVDSLVPTITKALYDSLPEVRHAAAETFSSLHIAVGNKALDEVIPVLLAKLDDPVVGDFVLDGLKQMLTVKSSAVLPYLIPQLTVTPINIRALSFLSCVAGDSLSKHLLKILPALLNVLSSSIDTDEEKQNSTYCKKILLSITDEQGSRTIIEYLFNTAKSDNKAKSLSSVMMLNMYCCNTNADLTIYTSILIRGLIHLLISEDERIITNSWEAFTAITKMLNSKQLIEYIQEIKTAVQFTYSDYKVLIKKTKPELLSDDRPLLLPGFCWSKGISPFLPYFKDSLSMGNPEQKELAANCLMEILKITSNDSIKSSVIIFSGALIRILGDTRSTTSLKQAVIEALTLMLEKVGTLMKQFMPQLQQSFLKLLNDQNRTVRIKAANALSYLVLVHVKPDVVINEILTMLDKKNNAICQPTEDTLIKETMVFAIRVCLIQAGSKFTPAIKSTIMKTVVSLLNAQDESFRTNLAACLGSLCKWVSPADLDSVAKNHLLEISSNEETNHSRAIALRICLKEAPERILAKADWNDKVVKALISHISNEKVLLSINGIKASAYYFLYSLQKQTEISTQLITTFSKCLNHSNNEIKTCVAQSASFVAKNYNPNTLPSSMLKILVPLLVNGTKEKNSIVKSNSEQSLITILKLRINDEIVNNLMKDLDEGPRTSLELCLQKTLRRVASIAEPKDDGNDFDETLLI